MENIIATPVAHAVKVFITMGQFSTLACGTLSNYKNLTF
jgi:hypothetical protein